MLVKLLLSIKMSACFLQVLSLLLMLKAMFVSICVYLSVFVHSAFIEFSLSEFLLVLPFQLRFQEAASNVPFIGEKARLSRVLRLIVVSIHNSRPHQDAKF